MHRLGFKGALEKALRYGGPARLAWAVGGRRPLILAYHNVVPDGENPAGDTALHLPQHRFAEQLDLLTSICDVVPLASFLNQAPSTGRRPRLAITFDDAYQGALTVGVAELEQRNLPATFFVAPAFVGGADFWWDALSEPHTGTLRPDLRRWALHERQGKDSAIRASLDGLGLRPRHLPAHSRCASEAQLSSAVRRGHITLASHSWSHPDLTALSGSELADQLRRSLGWIRERFQPLIPWLSYPYGFYSPAVVRAAAMAGYTAAVGITGGRLPSAPLNVFAIPRLHVPAQMSLDGFALRVAGLFSR